MWSDSRHRQPASQKTDGQPYFPTSPELRTVYISAHIFFRTQYQPGGASSSSSKKKKLRRPSRLRRATTPPPPGNPLHLQISRCPPWALRRPPGGSQTRLECSAHRVEDPGRVEFCWLPRRVWVMLLSAEWASHIIAFGRRGRRIRKGTERGGRRGGELREVW
ncbi:hypothetical protein BDY21DRAFT_134071 [Lineolata rhizophorae]|uniref:Uncharacterized protein n=1 Tax=Lineolata rhizophorae TaxID=578093 RepID=A0A6A6PA65_9PEZI|nr:hypothetical protein BDY21DRAFT_134071 [Lineolata rhizophorae]